MSDKDFVHLHVHTEFSLLDGLSRINDLVKRAKELEMPALAITDHGTMFGVVDFYRACKAQGVQPIIGVEAYLARRGMGDRDPKLDSRPFHLLLLARNQTGYQNLLKIASASQMDGFYYRPRIDREFLAGHAGGLIATSGCLAAEIPRLIVEGRDDEAKELIGWYQDVFGKENFFLELQQHDIPELETLNRWLVEYERSNHTQVELLATNDVHYVLQDDYDPHDTLLCIQTGALKSETNRLSMSDPSYHLTSQYEMWQFFHEVPGALQNSLKIAEMCDVDLKTEGYHLPVFPVPEGYDSASYLRYLCNKGLAWRYGSRADDPELRARLDYELEVVHNMGFETYFLIVWDLCEFAHHADIWWNVRGSGAGSLAAYCLGITKIDPMQNGLLFERFLNPGRVSMPDIDLDYPDDRRGEMIAYTAQKYGEDKVAAIITFGTLGAKAAVRDVGRALDVDLGRVNQAASLIPTEAKQKPLEVYVESNPELQTLYNSDRQIREMIDTAKRLQGVSRHASTHAAGVIVADKPLVEYLPLHRITGTDPSGGSLKAVTQFPMETCESIGLLKVDFLGLSTLTIMRKACDLIKRHRGIQYSMDNIPYRHDSDQVTDEQRAMLDEAFKLIGRGDTVGVFQVESSGMQQMLRGMRPTRFEHIVAAISLYRPGPMEYIPTYNDRMHGKEKVVYKHPKLESILAETFGIIVYQEQIMQIAGELFGYPLGDADLMRKAVSKKKEKDLRKHKAIFLERGPQNDVDEDTAGAIFDDIEFFANYGFNKCVVASTEIVDAKTGRLVRVGDLASGEARVAHTLTCDMDTLRLQSGRVSAIMSNGVKSVCRLTTQLGRQIDATANHPFYTFDGWRVLGDLAVGDRIGVPRQIPVEGGRAWADHEVIVLGHLLAEGNLCHPTGIYFYTGDDEQWRDYIENLEKFDNTVASTHCRRGMYDVYSKRVSRSRQAGVVMWVESLGLRNKDSYSKFIPDEVFELNNRQIALLIARMWEGDGHINEKGRSLYYATSSERMVRQLQHLLLRLGVISRLRRVEFPYRDGRIGYQLFVTGNGNLRVFSAEIGSHFVSCERRAILGRMVMPVTPLYGTRDVIPLGVRQIVRQEKSALGTTWTTVGQQAEVGVGEFSRKVKGTKIGFTRQIIGQLAEYFDSDQLRTYADSDIYWDAIVSIEYVGDEPTYDLTIDSTHNFVANDILVHNSHASDYAMITVQTAFLKTHYPEEYMTALLSVQRDDSTKVAIFLEDCRRMEIPILPPDVNYSMLDFDIEDTEDGKRAIRFGLAAVKNAGAAPLQHLLDARAEGGPFVDLEDFCRRNDLRVVQKRTLESLIRVGAFRDLGTRPQLLAALDRMIGFSSNYHKDKEVGQINMFGENSGVDTDDLLQNLPPIEEVNRREMLKWEKELLGLYVTGRPVDKYKASLRESGAVIVQQLKEAGASMSERSVRVAGEVVTMRKIVTRNNQLMCVAQLEDWHDTAASIEVVFFPRTWEKVQEKVDEGEIVMITGKFDLSRGDPQIIVEQVSTDFDLVTPDGEQPGVDDHAMPQWADALENDELPPMLPVTDAVPSWADEASGEAEYDEETGEVSDQPVEQKEPVSEDEIIPATEREVSRPGPTAEPQAILEEANGGSYQSYNGGNTQQVTRWLVIHFQRSDDADKDRRRLRRLHGLLVKYPGDDRFTIALHTADDVHKLEFPNHTTAYCDELMHDLASVVGAENVEVMNHSP